MVSSFMMPPIKSAIFSYVSCVIARARHLDWIKLSVRYSFTSAIFASIYASRALNLFNCSVRSWVVYGSCNDSGKSFTGRACTLAKSKMTARTRNCGDCMVIETCGVYDAEDRGCNE